MPRVPAYPEIVDITGVGSTAASAVLSANLVSQAAEKALYQVQANQGVNPRYMIKSYPLATPNQAAQKLSGKLRSLIAVLGVGVLLLFIAISIAEAMGKGKGRGNGDGTRGRRRGDPKPEPSTAAEVPDRAQPLGFESEPVEGPENSRFRSR